MEPITPRTSPLPIGERSRDIQPGFADALAASEEKSDLAETARQLEALLVERMLQAMRRSAKVPGQEETHQNVEFFQQLADQELARHIVAGQRAGLADAIERQLAPTTRQEPSIGLTSVENRSIDNTRTSP